MYRAYDRDGPIIDGHVYDLKNPSRTGAPPARFNPHRAGKTGRKLMTVDTLQRRTGAYFGRAKVHMEWSAISTWLMAGDATEAIAAAGIPYDVASVAVRLVREAKEHAKGWPRLSRHDATPVLHNLSGSSRNEAGRIANEVYRLWQYHGQPMLLGRLIEDTYLHIVAAVREGLLEPIPEVPADVSQARLLPEPFCPAALLKI